MTDSQVRDELRYTEDHEWVRLDGDAATVGITDHAQHAMGDITYVELPSADQSVSRGGELAVVESAKAASDVYSPLSGTVIEANDALDDTPETINADPYGGGWICKLSLADPSEADSLLTPAQYREHLAQEGQ